MGRLVAGWVMASWRYAALLLVVSFFCSIGYLYSTQSDIKVPVATVCHKLEVPTFCQIFYTGVYIV